MRNLHRYYSFVLPVNSLAIAMLVTASMKAQTAGGSNSQAQAAPKDILLFSDGEKLIGEIESATDTSVTFKSDVAGEVTVDWSKIQELQSPRRFALVKKGVKFSPSRQPASIIPQGTIAMREQKLDLTRAPGAAPQTSPVGDTQRLMEQAAFEKALQTPNFFAAWKGSASFGATLVQATQDNRTFTSGIALTRDIPTESWMNPENRTKLDFTSSYGELTQPGVPTVKTSIYHAGAQRDEYFSPSWYASLNAGFDHNYSQGLDLQQAYGGGIGWTVIKDKDQELDLKAELTYIRRSFLSLGSQIARPNENLIGASFGETYNRTLSHKMVLSESLLFLPAFNNTKAWSAAENVSLTIPVFKRLGVTIGTLDTFLNDPPPGFKKNSFQFITALTYTLP